MQVHTCRPTRLHVETCSRERCRRRCRAAPAAGNVSRLVRSSTAMLLGYMSSSNTNSGGTNYRVVSAIKTQITWVNGIGHNLEHMNLPTSVISKLFGGTEPEFCHNPTAMTSEEDYFGYLGDLTQAGTQKLGRITAEVDALVGHLKAALSRVGKNGKIVHIAHSQGALITSLAAKQLDASELSRIEVIAFGGAAALRRCPDTPFARCVNYYSVNDPLLALVPSAEKALRSGFLSVCSMGLPSDEPEFVFLTPRGGDPILDHGLLGPTYLKALEWEGRRFQRLYQPISHKAARAISIYVAYALQGLMASLRAILRKTIVAFILFVQDINAHIYAAVVETVKVILKPIILLVKMLQELLTEAIRMARGNEEKFEQVQ